MKFLLLACALVMFCPAVHAEDALVMDGNQLVIYCHNVETASSFKEGVCYGFVMGVETSYLITHGFVGVKPAMCVPSAVTNGQTVKVVVKYLNTHPEQLHLSATYLTLVALIEAFPCPVELEKPKK